MAVLERAAILVLGEFLNAGSFVMPCPLVLGLCSSKQNKCRGGYMPVSIVGTPDIEADRR
jgi:hypothetical protein